MLKIVIRNLNNKTIISNNNSKTVLNIIHEHYVDWMHACGAKGRCTTCKMIVLEGAENLSEDSPFEKKCRSLNKIESNERLACQCTLEGAIIIKVPQEYKLPHQSYSD
ncbi:2Fe-2S iron-sulfur cluster-binding protein [Fulvivirgaceae bacterium BMA10]|uniref:2Fe-2S iron-sulfur cluster-binding protein n=1 Tax=Splendidivirga corallicola TaxID=3051826 RepID=A0ABT8KRG2_9BACT|nr:2Fe-2S iron-sulfur cluster-binding protein [Fulvivirgaceae bacterium BMA10]